MKKTLKKLTLKSETIKQLDEIKLQRVAGGISAQFCSEANCGTASGCNTNCLCTYAQSICRCTFVGCSLYPTCTCGAG